MSLSGIINLSEMSYAVLYLYRYGRCSYARENARVTISKLPIVSYTSIFIKSVWLVLIS